MPGTMLRAGKRRSVLSASRAGECLEAMSSGRRCLIHGCCVRRNIVSGVQRLGALATDGEMMGGVMACIGERPMYRRSAADLSDGERRLWMALKRALDAEIDKCLAAAGTCV